ncbi:MULTISPECIES: YwbE family protein [unclassified Polaribacter]|uniref:YwbE family protein n=1 Tax=unclassified Polaribacter TaxID=196858 RepID=UPI0011BE25A8|nr:MULTISPECIES: YwbE family protein [unclassified Polaribacter]TXD52537.1 YwbE family protein [Polaribacter sp. IC063]TXD60523.1 YwbE family protein [Polaribacter sp. IC066]
MIDGRKRVNIKIGLFVEIVQKPHQRTGELTAGRIAKILTKSLHHPYGIKVQLESGLVGRVQKIIE